MSEGCGPGLAAYSADVARFLIAEHTPGIAMPEFPETICKMCALEMYMRLCHLMQHVSQDVSMIAIDTYEEREELLVIAEGKSVPTKTIN